MANSVMKFLVLCSTTMGGWLCARISITGYRVNCGCIKILVVGTPRMEQTSYLVHVYEILPTVSTALMVEVINGT